MPIRSYRYGSTDRGWGGFEPVFTERGWGGRIVDDELEIDEAGAEAEAVAREAKTVEVPAVPTQAITSQTAQKAKAELGKMRASLAGWLRYRRINDEIASGRSLPRPLLAKPTAKRQTAAAFGLQLAQTRASDEAKLASRLHLLLSEVFDAQGLPEPDIRKNPNAAVELAEIAIAGKLPGKDAAPEAAGFVWLWPMVVVVGVIAFVITSKIRSDAEVAKERERLECIKQGACTDTGFWLKVGAVGLIAWFVWNKRRSQGSKRA